MDEIPGASSPIPKGTIGPSSLCGFSFQFPASVLSASWPWARAGPLLCVPESSQLPSSSAFSVPLFLQAPATSVICLEDNILVVAPLEPTPSPTPGISRLQGLVHPDPLSSLSLFLGPALPTSLTRAFIGTLPLLKGPWFHVSFLQGVWPLQADPCNCSSPQGLVILNRHCCS